MVPSKVPFIGRLSPTDDESPRPTTTLFRESEAEQERRGHGEKEKDGGGDGVKKERTGERRLGRSEMVGKSGERIAAMLRVYEDVCVYVCLCSCVCVCVYTIVKWLRCKER